MEISKRQHGAVTIIRPDGPLVTEDAERFTRDAIEAAGEAMGRLVVDASSVSYLDSAGLEGLLSLSETLEGAGIPTAGAGRDLHDAAAPAILEHPAGGRIVVFAFGFSDSGIPADWLAGPSRSGIWLLPDYSDETVGRVGRAIRSVKRDGDVVVASIHWGGNWGYGVSSAHRRFAHALVDDGGVDLVHGHSSHHPRAIEVYRERLVLYGCGDFLNDYEGIRGHEEFRGDLVVMYFPCLETDGRLLSLDMSPLRIRRFQLERPDPEEVTWMRDTLSRECRSFGGDVVPAGHGRLRLTWGRARSSPANRR